MKARAPTEADAKWMDSLEEGSNSSKCLVVSIDGQRLIVRVMGRLFNDKQIDAVCLHVIDSINSNRG